MQMEILIIGLVLLVLAPIVFTAIRVAIMGIVRTVIIIGIIILVLIAVIFIKFDLALPLIWI